MRYCRSRLGKHAGDGRRHVRPCRGAVPLLWLGLIDGEALLVLEHLAMFPLMFLVMLRRRDEYGGAPHG